MLDQVENKIKEIKQSFRFLMNGPASQSMREKGLDYRLNWGVPFIQLKSMAKNIEKDYDLAIALWKEDIRECKILATLLMPAEKMPQEVAEIWMQAFNLYQYVSYAPVIAYQWMASHEDVYQICAYGILARLFMKGQEPNERGINEFIDQAVTALKQGSAGVRHAAMNAMLRFIELGVVYERVATSALKRERLELL